MSLPSFLKANCDDAASAIFAFGLNSFRSSISFVLKRMLVILRKKEWHIC